MEDKDFWDQEWEQEVPESELMNVKKQLRKHNRKTIMITTALVAILLLGCIFGIIPAVERLYWNADEFSYGKRSDLEATLYAYTELFNPSHSTTVLNFKHIGFASYDLDLRLLSRTGRDLLNVSGTLTRNTLSMDPLLSDTSYKNYFLARHQLPFSTPDQEVLDSIHNQVQELPEYIQVEAAVSFNSDITMAALVEWKENYPMLRITWVAIRVTEPTTEWTPVCGMSPFMGGSVFDGMYQDYPYFNIASVHDAGQMEQHFKSLLQYSADQISMGRGICHYDDTAFYQNALDYVTDNGVMTYGCYIYGSPKVLLPLFQDDMVADVRILDAWLDIQ